MTVLLVLTAMLHLSVARHYCGGELAATKVSLSGALATCGMEDTEGNCPYDHNDYQIESHCCEDDLTAYSIDNNYTPAAKVAVQLSTAKIAVPHLSFVSPARFPDIKTQAWSDIGPPGLLMTSSVDLAEIRVLRI